MIKYEINRLLNGVEESNKVDENLLVDFEVKCGKKTEVVLGRCKEVLKIVLENSVGKWPSIDEWRQLLPQWFIERCAREITMEEAEKRLSLSIEERKEINRKEGWTLSAWIYWFNPEERKWFWWDAKIYEEDTIIITVECISWPFPWRSLEWLFIASGAMSVEEL
ncbi:MAG: hypothetical protein ACYDG2_17130 [Ruminiclostridium sp.]